MKKTFFFICLIIVFLCFPNLVFNAIGDPPVNGVEPFIYYNMPDTSFGSGNFKDVNWSFFKNMFQNHFYKDCNYKRYSYSDWTNGNSYVTINKTWNDSGFWKIDINLDVPVDIFEVNISFGCDLPVLNYVEREGYEIWLNYSIDDSDEIYQVYFNWSDIADISGLTINKHYDSDSKIWWISLHRNNIPSGFYSFDPIFGHEFICGTGGLMADGDDFYAWEFKTNGAGTCDYIMLYCNYLWGAIDVRCLLYYENLSFVANGQTEEVTVSNAGSDWIRFNFTGSKPIISDENYFLGVHGDGQGGARGLVYYENNTGGIGRFADLTHGIEYPNYPNPLTNDSWNDLQLGSIYCSYTVGGGNNNPTFSGQDPYNSSTDVSTTPALYVICTDADSDAMNVTWRYNDTDEWWDFAENTSVSSGTNITQTNSNFSNNSQIYYWSVNCSDGEGGWINETYHFMTIALPASITVSDEFPSNNSNTAPTQPYLYVTVNHSTGETMNISWYYGASEGSENTLLGTDVNISNSTQNQLFLEASSYSTEYFWRVMVNDGEGLWINETFIFNTTGTSGSGRTTSLWIIGVLFGIFGIMSLFLTTRRKEMKKIKKPKNHSGDEYYGSDY